MNSCEVGVIDYGIGNLRSVSNALTALGAMPVVSKSPSRLMECSHLILPGVGAFKKGMEALNERNLVPFLNEVVENEKPLLGICLGMQLLMESSTEFGNANGLGFVQGEVKRIGCCSDKNMRLPHVSWKPLSFNGGESTLGLKILEGVSDQEFYFIHSYCVDFKNLSCDAYTSFYGEKVAAVVSKNKVIGTQFHPEKSGPSGLKVLSNFLKI